MKFKDPSYQQGESSGSILALLLGLFPILLLGFSTILLEARIAFLWMGLVIYPILYLTILIAAGVGWYWGSPRWSYSYTGFLLVFTWYLTSLRAPTFTIVGFRFPPHGELWDSWAWLPVLITLLIVLLVSHSWRPLQQFFRNIKSDWTLYTFLLYTAMPWLSWALFDEIRSRPLVIISLFVADLSIWMGIWFYFHSRTISQRAYSLFYGLLPASLITVIATSAYWHGRQEFWMPQPGNGYIDALREGLFYVVIFLILFFPGLVSPIKQKLLNLRST
jgi:hypothetical protein